MAKIMQVLFSFVIFYMNFILDDGTVQKELNNVYNQIQSHQRELKTLQTKYANSATFER